MCVCVFGILYILFGVLEDGKEGKGWEGWPVRSGEQVWCNGSRDACLLFLSVDLQDS